MSEEILVNVTPRETRVAVIEGGILQEVHIERSSKRGIVGNIYKGKVSRVLPGIQAAFIDIGLERSGFLQIADISNTNLIENNENDSKLKIESIVNENNEILVQATKDPIGNKGARLTTHLSIPSRYAVLTPKNNQISISRRIEGEDERERLRNIVLSYCSGLEELNFATSSNVVLHASLSEDKILDKSGYIIRTAAENITATEIYKDLEFLEKIWDTTLSMSQKVFAPNIIFEDLPLEIRTIRDLVNHNIQKIRIDCKRTFEEVIKFSKEFIPEFTTKIEYYSGEQPILDLYSVEDDIQNSLNRMVKLKSAGYLIIDQTEAMTTIDVNTGAFVGHNNQQETIYKTNLEAAHTISRQLRLRNLGGIIIIDFIDMQDSEHRRQVLRALQKNISHDRSRISISELTSLGLVQLTRKRTTESLEHILCEDCPTCEGKGSIKTIETICHEIFREILREVRQFDADKLLVIASESVIETLLGDESSNVAEFESIIESKITFQIETSYTQEQFDIVLL